MMKDILTIITRYREKRSRTYQKNMVPTIPYPEKICGAFGITLSQLFAEGKTSVTLTKTQKELLERWAGLNREQQADLFGFMSKPEHFHQTHRNPRRSGSAV